MYSNAHQGFHNDSTGRYDEKSANLAWERTLAFFNEQLAQPGSDQSACPAAPGISSAGIVTRNLSAQQAPGQVYQM